MFLFPKPLPLLFGSIAVTILACSGWCEILSARLEILQLEREYRDQSDLDTARGFEDGLLEFQIEFDIADQVAKVTLITPNSVEHEAQKEGDLFRTEVFIGTVSTLLQGIYQIEVVSSTGALSLSEFEVETLLFPDYPEVEFPYDGLDQADAEDLQAEWNGTADTDRVDLFEIRPDLFNFPPEIAERLATWRTGFGDQDLEDELFEERRYELWIGSTLEETVNGEGGFEVQVWLTSSKFLRFTTGPDPRERLDGFLSTEFIQSVRAGTLRNRFGNTGQEDPARIVAEMIGSGIFEAEIGLIRGLQDARPVGSSFDPMQVVEAGTGYRREVQAVAGNALLFLAEFSTTHRLGSETASVQGPLSFPVVTGPPSGASGLGASIPVEWTFSGTADGFEISLDEVGGGGFTTLVSVGGGERAAVLDAVPADKDFLLAVTVFSLGGSKSTVTILASTLPQGDFDANGTTDRRDLFGFALRWKGEVLPPDAQTDAPGSFRLDADGNGILDPTDLATFLSAVR